MLLTRSIRRKMVLCLTAVAVMLVILAGGVLSGLSGYRKSIDRLDESVHRTPRRAEIADAVTGLFDTLLAIPRSHEGREERRENFLKQLEDVRKTAFEYRRKLDDLPTPQVNARLPVEQAILDDLLRRSNRLKTMAGRLGEEETDPSIVARMRDEVAILQTRTLQLPDSRAHLLRTLQDMQAVYRSRAWFIGVSGTLVSLLFLSLVYFGYRWIFVPIRVLHQGAARVAQGDFDYRVTLDTNDEMSELADAFNKMTTRFQEIAGDLDRQVKERSRQLVRSERLVGVGFLAAGVAHEINNPLSAICMAAESIQGRFRDLLEMKHNQTSPDETTDDELEVITQYLKMIRDESLRCREITARLLDFSRSQDAILAAVDVTTVITEVLDLVGHMSKFRDREIEFVRTTPCVAVINRAEIKQVVLNLVANALEASEEGGSLRVEAEDLTDRVILSFRDDGCGMTSEDLDVIFEPFFTQRNGGGGTGLGLSISHRIISEHEGTIEAASDGPGQGSTFRVDLPKRLSGQAAA